MCVSSSPEIACVGDDDIDKICRLEGTMSPQARDATIKHFSGLFSLEFHHHFMSLVVNNVDVTVFLVSLKAGGVALNLTEASHVYLMDSWWNPAVSFICQV